MLLTFLLLLLIFVPAYKINIVKYTQEKKETLERESFCWVVVNYHVPIFIYFFVLNEMILEVKKEKFLKMFSNDFIILFDIQNAILYVF